jgi:hypothetical protein
MLMAVGVGMAVVAVGLVGLAELRSTPDEASADPYAWSIPRGELLYEADLSDTTDFVIRNRGVLGNVAADPSVGDVDSDEGSVAIEVTSPVAHAGIGVEQMKVLPARYAAEILVTVEPKARNFTFHWRVASGAHDEHIVLINADSETAQLKYATSEQSDLIDVSDKVPLSGMVVGRDVRLGFVKDGARYVLLVDGRPLSQGTDERMSRQTQTFFFRVFERGLVTIHSIRVYAVN